VYLTLLVQLQNSLKISSVLDIADAVSVVSKIALIQHLLCRRAVRNNTTLADLKMSFKKSIVSNSADTKDSPDSNHEFFTLTLIFKGTLL
jgi:hypothetical protein